MDSNADESQNFDVQSEVRSRHEAVKIGKLEEELA